MVGEITIDVHGIPWSVSDKSLYLLTEKSKFSNTWSKPVWFPKSICKFDLDNNKVTVPLWFYNKNIK